MSPDHSGPGDVRWQTLIRRYPSDPRLLDATIYALPHRLLRAIMVSASDLLSLADYQFEYRLRQQAGTGFFRRQAFGSELLDPVTSREVARDRYGGDRRLDALRDVQLAMHRHGDHGTAAEALQQSLALRIQERQRGFAGNPQFRADLTDWQRAWTDMADLSPPLPSLAEWSASQSPGLHAVDRERLSHYRRAAGDFLRRWNLDSLQTPDLPIPVAPVLLTGDDLPRNELQSIGVSLFLPWYLFSDRDLRLTELLQYHQARQDLSRFEGWTYDEREDGWGAERYAKLFQLYIYLHRAIRVRYGDQLIGQLGHLDRAIARFFDPLIADEEALAVRCDSIRKIRRKLEQRLKEIENEASGGGSQRAMPNSTD